MKDQKPKENRIPSARVLLALLGFRVDLLAPEPETKRKEKIKTFHYYISLMEH